MDDITETATHGAAAVSHDVFGIVKHVLNMDTENKNMLMNMVQYTLLSVAPVLLLLRGVKELFPDEDDRKSSVELLLECVGQLLFLVLGIWVTQRAVSYIPTYSGAGYAAFRGIEFIIPFVLILTTLQTKLGGLLIV